MNNKINVDIVINTVYLKLNRFSNHECSKFKNILTNYAADLSNGGIHKSVYEYFVELTSQNCSYCGSAPSNLRVSRSGNCSYLYNGIDRVSNDKGYVTGNCAPCCKRCNAAKSDLSENDFLILVKDIFYNKKLNHLPVNDAKGNAEVLLQMHEMGLNIPIK